MIKSIVFEKYVCVYFESILDKKNLHFTNAIPNIAFNRSNFMLNVVKVLKYILL